MNQPNSPRSAAGESDEELIATQRLAMLGNMSAMIAHEFNNLLTPILARADFALMTGEPADMKKSLERTKTQIERAMAITRRLLALANHHQDALELSAVSVAETVEEAVATAVRPFDKDGIELRVDVPGDLQVTADQSLFVQVLLNLLLNARAAMKKCKGTLRVSARQDGSHVLIAVRDSGCGIDPQTLHDVINPFLRNGERDPNAWRAVGLGLNVCRVICQRHDAQLRGYVNDSGRGVTFELRWPAAGR